MRGWIAQFRLLCGKLDSYQSNGIATSNTEWQLECVSARWTLKCAGVTNFTFKTSGCDHNHNALGSDCLTKAGVQYEKFLLLVSLHGMTSVRSQVKADVDSATTVFL